MPRTRLYRNETLADEGFPVAKVSDYLTDDGTVIWFDLCAPSAADLATISEELDTHFEAVQALDSQIEALEDQLFDDDPRDVYDHVLRATEWTESLRDLVTTILETHLTVRGNRLNIIMKQVTSWAAIIAVPTAVTDFYGQNVPYPGFGHPAGFWASTLVMVVLSVGLFVVFRRKDWL